MPLRPHVPVTAKIMPIDPDDPFFKSADIEIGVRGAVQAEAALEEYSPVERSAVGGCRRGLQREVEGFPIHEGHPVQGNAIGNAFTIDEILREIDMSHAFHQDLEERVFYIRLWQPDGPVTAIAVNGVDEFTIEIDHGKIVRLGNGQLAALMPDETGAIEDHAAALVKMFHGLRLCGMFGGRKMIP